MTISDLARITIERGVWRTEQVEAVRSKVNEVVSGLNRLGRVASSIAIRVLSGEVRSAPTTPQGFTTYTFASLLPEEVPHGLGRVPTGYVVIRRYPLGVVADASLADWNERTAWLQSETAGLTITVIWF